MNEKHFTYEAARNYIVGEETFYDVDKEYLDDSDYWFSLVQELLEATENDKEIAYIAAGPLEDLLNKYADEIKGELTEALRQSGVMRKAVTAVIVSEGTTASSVLHDILREFGLKYASL